MNRLSPRKQKNDPSIVIVAVIVASVVAVCVATWVCTNRNELVASAVKMPQGISSVEAYLTISFIYQFFLQYCLQ